jgi:hypothetical protein
MTDEIVQVNEDGEVKTGSVEVDVPLSGSILASVPSSTTGSTSESAEDTWKSFQTQTSTFFANIAESLSEFFKNNKPLLINLGWVLLALLGLQLLFTILDVVDNLPLISPILKLVGLIYIGWFVWRYLLRASNRQELGQIIDHTKSELLGDRS